MNNTANPGDEARSKVNGDNVHELFADVADPDADGHAKSPYAQRPVKLAEDAQFGSPQAATTVGGLYAAEHGKARGTLTDGGYKAVAALRSVSVVDAKSLGLIDHTPSEADVARWYHEGGYGQWEPTEASVLRAGMKTAMKGLDATRKVALTTVDALAGNGVPWAVRAAARAAADNLDSGVKAKTYSFTLTELYNDYDAATEDLIGLPPMTTETRLASLRLLRTWFKAEDARALSEGRELEAARAIGEVPEWEWFKPNNRANDRAPHLVAGLLKGGEASSALLVAQRKAGKSTACDEIAHALATGGRAFGQLATALPDGWRVVVLDTEMADEDIIDTYARCGPLINAGRVLYADLIGRAALLDVRTEKALAYWDDKIPEHSVIIIDCLGPLLSAAGISENSSDVAMILDGLVTLAKRRRSVLVVVHHLGKDETQGARGHSSMEGKFGAVLKLTYHGDEPGDNQPRFLSAYGRRGIGLGGRRKITRDADGHLVMDGDATATAGAAHAEQRQLDESIFELINMYPLLSVTGLAETQAAKTSKWSGEAIRSALDRLASAGRAVNLGNGGGHMWVPQWLRDPTADHDRHMHTAETANSIAVEGSTAHEAAVRVCVEAVCALVKRDPTQAGLPETKMLTAVRKPGYPPRKVHIVAWTRWKAACDAASAGQLSPVVITDPDQVLSLPTPEWSKGQGVYRLGVGPSDK
ncbi:AAA family ATPase [Mycolicibacterium tokaiense]|uniref:Uncharacterized protein n=1 Tax=Mycolicibacterium tokaiense TaxID=39695 RepID=A0A378TLR8_9MYCO|nr:AAA family ATPase [Mycolicibacterium tokaiense]STZ60803.1 Uncharacterised protein [Mycolicibacterium tokaiense]